MMTVHQSKHKIDSVEYVRLQSGTYIPLVTPLEGSRRTELEVLITKGTAGWLNLLRAEIDLGIHELFDSDYKRIGKARLLAIHNNGHRYLSYDHGNPIGIKHPSELKRD